VAEQAAARKAAETARDKATPERAASEAVPMEGAARRAARAWEAYNVGAAAVASGAGSSSTTEVARDGKTALQATPEPCTVAAGLSAVVLAEPDPFRGSRVKVIQGRVKLVVLAIKNYNHGGLMKIPMYQVNAGDHRGWISDWEIEEVSPGFSAFRKRLPSLRYRFAQRMSGVGNVSMVWLIGHRQPKGAGTAMLRSIVTAPYLNSTGC
jgi:hypothetical protein